MYMQTHTGVYINIDLKAPKTRNRNKNKEGVVQISWSKLFHRRENITK